LVRRFTFAAGNVRKILALPLYGFGALASRVVSRKDRLWVFASGIGVGEGALALLLHARAADPSLRLVWLARNDRDVADAKALGIPVARGSSWRGFRLTLRARVIVVTHGLGDANRFGTTGGLVVQLWHGIPFKHIGLDSGATLQVPILSRFGFLRAAFRRAYQRTARGIGMFATASALSASRVRAAFGLGDDRVIVTGDPRDDVLVVGTAAVRERTARDLIVALLGDERFATARILLYAPTWRDGEPDPAIPAETDWRRIHRYLSETNSLLIVRSHHLGVGDYSAGGALSDRVRMLGADLQGDVTPLLPAVGALITDYSSIAFDYALLGGELLFFAPDVAEYSASRGLYESYADFSGGTEVTTWTAVIDLLEAGDRNPAIRENLRAHAVWLAARAHAYRDGHNTARVYDAIISRLNGLVVLPAVDSNARLRVDAITITIGEGANLMLTVSGEIGDMQPTAARLEGSRLVLPGDLVITGNRFTATIPLLSSRWRGPRLPPPSGRYGLRIAGPDARPLELHVTAPRPDPTLYPALFRASVVGDEASVILEFSAPLTDAERGPAGQARLGAEYRRARPTLTEAVFFESYFGQNASCNPRAIDRALVAVRPDVTRYWSVTDASVEVPVGAIAIIEGSEEWWRARASSRLLVVNDWLRKRYTKHGRQNVLQTWHGTPLKKIALSRKGVRPRAAVATLREKSRWDVMLAQNQFSSDIFRSAYAVRSPIWQEGYPRDDVLLTGDAASVRARLGIPDGVKVVLYAPTWRDDRPGKIDHLDVATFTKELGPGFVTLIRGHSRTMRPGSDLFATGVVDVTSYPDISELFLVADALVTDYSSVMFDFTVTGKPLYFFAPDLAHYRDQLRGFYFDLLPVAPGPVLSDPADLIRYLRDPDAHISEYAERYVAWQAKFNPRDDGHAAERVVRRLIAEGMLD
jgi:CDP-glycerol glycerophosphotransferase (TagB/SpsB family)